MAILAGWASDVRHHGALAVGAILTTWAANYGVILLGRELMEVWFRHHSPGPAVQLTLWVTSFLGGGASGLLVIILHNRLRGSRRIGKRGATYGG